MLNNKKHNKEIEEALNNCLESMFSRNESLDSCLERYPAHSRELKPLLETMKAARLASSLSADVNFRARARCEFRTALYNNMNPPRKAPSALSLRWAVFASTVGVLVLTSAGGAVAASSGSMPGQPLYELKRDVENVQLSLAPSQAAKARLYATLADRRIGELLYSAQMGDVKTTEDLTRQFSADLSMVSTITANSRNSSYGDGKSAPTIESTGFPGQISIDNTQAPTYNSTVPPMLSPVTTSVTMTGSVATPSSTPRPSTSNVPGTTATNALPPPSVAAVVPPQNQSNLSGITDPALLKLLQQYSVKNIADLNALKDKVPASVLAALQAAITAALAGYGQILG